MYLAADIGGTKTLLAVFNQQGKVTDSVKFPTPKQYHHFLMMFEHYFKMLETADFRAAGVAVPGKIDHEHGRGIAFGNLSWRNVPIQTDIEKIVGVPVVIENDTKLAGLSEAKLIIKEFKRVLYVTISTGIGSALIIDGVIDPGMIDSEGGQMWLDYHGKKTIWEDFASGHAIVERFGKRASDIDDPVIWREISTDLASGLLELIAVIQPEVIVLGGGVSTNFAKFQKPLSAALKKYETPLVPIPPIIGAKRPEEAVIYGCYELAKHHFPAPSSKTKAKAKTKAKTRK